VFAIENTFENIWIFDFMMITIAFKEKLKHSKKNPHD
jgi:hypothetical protein